MADADADGRAASLRTPKATADHLFGGKKKMRTDQTVSRKGTVEGQTPTVSLGPEGTYTGAGDLVVELDSSDMVDRKCLIRNL